MAGEGAITPELLQWLLWDLPVPQLLAIMHARARYAGQICIAPEAVPLTQRARQTIDRAFNLATDGGFQV